MLKWNLNISSTVFIVHVLAAALRLRRKCISSQKKVRVKLSVKKTADSLFLSMPNFAEIGSLLLKISQWLLEKFF